LSGADIEGLYLFIYQSFILTKIYGNLN